MSTLLKRGASALFILTLPVFLFAGSLLYAVLDVGTYERAFLGYGAAARTGLSDTELRTTAASFAEHFRTGKPIDLTVARGGVTQPLFGEREIIHLRDVHDLTWFGLRGLAALAAYMAVFAAAGAVWWRGSYRHSLAGHVQAGGLLTIGLSALLVVGSLLNFEQLFWTFHVVSFPNDFWLLDPRQHYLINLFTNQFFLDATLGAALAANTAALVLVLLAVIVRRRAPSGAASRTI
ncbi:MAG: lipoprotein intramolecular transacylase Lit [Chloroflexota bacterium]